MGLWRFIEGCYGEEELWVPERGSRQEWPDVCDFPPCPVCVGRLTRRTYHYDGKDDQKYTGYRYTITHYDRQHIRRITRPVV